MYRLDYGNEDNKAIIELLEKEDVYIPKHWCAKTALHLIGNTDSAFLLKEFNVRGVSGWLALMKKVFPKKPDHISYMEYARKLPTRSDRPVSTVVSDDEDNSFEAHKAAHYARHVKNKIIPEEEYEGNN